jgi:glycosyltransferase involved in cell wall biosynthesis
MQPLVSIVTAAHNTEKYLEDYIKSILNQTYKNWEIVFVDDASTDKTVQKIKEIVIKNNIIDRVKLFRHADQYGYGCALHHCIEKSSGEIIAIVDSDDALSKENALELMVTTHINNPDASLVYSDYNECRDDLVPYKGINCTVLKPGQTVLGAFRNGKYMGTDVIISHLKTFKKSFYDMTEGVNPLLKKAVDRDIVLKLEEVGSLIHISKFLYLHRIHSTSISSLYRGKPREYKNEVIKMKTQMYREAWERRKKKKEHANC